MEGADSETNRSWSPRSSVGRPSSQGQEAPTEEDQQEVTECSSAKQGYQGHKEPTDSDMGTAHLL
jgi:hypothetical protein